MTAGGKIANGSATQAVRKGQDGEPVEVMALPGYYFMGWSDGVPSTSRVDRGVEENLTITARFAKNRELPDANDFEQGELANGWYTMSIGQTYNSWFVTRLAQSSLAEGEGYFAACNSDVAGPGGLTESYLYSPCYNLPAGWDADVLVYQEYLARFRPETTMTLQMATDDGKWQNLTNFEDNIYSLQPVEVRIPKAHLVGKSHLQLRWKYQTAYAYAVELDNIQVVKEIVEPVKIHYEAIPAGAATFNLLNDDGSLAQENITAQEVVQGQRPRPVEVVPASGYSLLSWDDGATDATLTSLKPVYTDATRRATLADAEKVLVALASMPEEGGDCQIGGVPARQQWVSKGDNLGPIVAMPKAGYRFVKWVVSGCWGMPPSPSVGYSRLPMPTARLTTACQQANTAIPCSMQITILLTATSRCRVKRPSR